MKNCVIEIQTLPKLPFPTTVISSKSSIQTFSFAVAAVLFSFAGSF